MRPRGGPFKTQANPARGERSTPLEENPRARPGIGASLRHMLIGTAIAAVLFGAVSEIALRFLPVIHNADWPPVSAAQPIRNYRPNVDITWSKGPDFYLATTRHSNNAGFLNDQDYTREGPRPLLAVVGDSYVEAIMLPYDETHYGRLAKRVGDRGRVYSFGMSSSPLSQYLAFAALARDEYAPDAFVFPIIGNDFDESLFPFKRSPAFHYFADDATVENPSLMRVDYEPNWKRAILRKSRLAAYLVFHLEVTARLDNQIARLFDRPSLPTATIQDWNRAADLFLAGVLDATGVTRDRIVFVVEGIRPALYKKPWAESREYFMAKAKAEGFEVIDLQPAYETGEKLDFERDGHWNARGHAIVGEAIAGSDMFRRIFPVR